MPTAAKLEPLSPPAGDVAEQTGLALANYDILAQLAIAGGVLRRRDLTNRALISRSGMTRWVARLLEGGLVRRADAIADGRGVVVALTDANAACVAETAPIHAQGIAEYFVPRLDDEERVLLERILDKVTIDGMFC
ncbi:MAG TPA: MarR family winged helix-turn-helix transcriptional regulator [Candidatus Limnocylindrales bacterium]|nr:MarR family winged helix-turn-helix transcriptional regulator [Candidatus Limnocylindrales bacterium]